MARASASRIKAGEAFIEIVADNLNLMKGLKAAQKSVTNFGQKLKDLGSDMFILGGFISMPLVKSLETFAEFDDKMRTLKGVSGANETTMKGLREEILHLGATTAFTARQVAEGAIELARFGFEADEVSTALKPTLDLVRSTGESVNRLGEFAGYASSVLKIFKKSAQDFGNVTDVMAFSANKSATSLADYYESMKMAGPYAQMVGESLEGASAALMLMANMGVRGSLAGTSLRNVYQVLAAESGKLTGATKEENQALSKTVQYFADLGINLKDSKGNLVKVSKIMDDLKKKLKTMPKSSKLNFLIDKFGLRGSLGASSMLNDYEDYFQNYEKELERLYKTQKAYKDKIAKEQEAGLGGFLRGMKSRLEGMSLSFGVGFWKTIEKYKKAILGTTSGILEFIQQNQVLISKLVFVTASLFTAGIALYGLGTAIKIVGNSLGFILGAISSVGNILSGAIGFVFSFTKGLWALSNALYKATNATFVFLFGLKKTIISLFFLSKNIVKGTVIPLYFFTTALVKAKIALIGLGIGILRVIKNFHVFAIQMAHIKRLSSAFGQTVGAVFTSSFNSSKISLLRLLAVLKRFKNGLSLAPLAIFGAKLVAVAGIVTAGMYAFYRYNKVVANGVKNYIKQSEGIQRFKNSAIKAFNEIKNISSVAFGSTKGSLEVGDLSGAIQTAIAGLKLGLSHAFEPFFEAWDHFYDRNKAWIEGLRVAAITMASKIARAAMNSRHKAEAAKDEEYVVDKKGNKIYKPKEKLYSLYGPAVYYHDEKTKETQQYKDWARIKAENKARREAEAAQFEKDLEKSLNSNLQNDAETNKKAREAKRAKLANEFNAQVTRAGVTASYKKLLNTLVEDFQNNAEQKFKESFAYVRGGKQDIDNSLKVLDQLAPGQREIRLREGIIKLNEILSRLKEQFSTVSKEGIWDKQTGALNEGAQEILKDLTLEYGKTLMLLQKARERLDQTREESVQAVEEKDSQKRESFGAWTYQELQQALGKSIAQKTLDATLAGNKILNNIKKNTKRETTPLREKYV